MKKVLSLLLFMSVRQIQVCSVALKLKFIFEIFPEKADLTHSTLQVKKKKKLSHREEVILNKFLKDALI